MNETSSAIEKTNGHEPVEERGTGTLVVHRDDGFRLAMEPANMGALYDIADQFAKIGLCGLKSPQEAIARILTGRELGLSLMQSMRGVYVVEGNPSLSASLKQSICLAHPDTCEEFRMIESTNERCVYRVKRRGNPAQDFTWTIEDAQRAKLVKNDSGWTKYPRRMLQARCKGEAADVSFGDLLHGFPTTEDLTDIREERPPVSGEQAALLSAKPRDWAAEMHAIEQTIDTAKTKESWAAARKSIDAWDAPDHWSKQLRAHYDTVVAARKAAQDAKKATTATATAQAAPVPAAPASAPAEPPFPEEPAKPAGRQPGED